MCVVGPVHIFCMLKSYCRKAAANCTTQRCIHGTGAHCTAPKHPTQPPLLFPPPPRPHHTCPYPPPSHQETHLPGLTRLLRACLPRSTVQGRHLHPPPPGLVQHHANPHLPLIPHKPHSLSSPHPKCCETHKHTCQGRPACCGLAPRGAVQGQHWAHNLRHTLVC